MKKIFLTFLVLLSVPVLSGCFNRGSSEVKLTEASFMVSVDGGETFSPRVSLGDEKGKKKKTIAGVDVLVLTLDPQNSQRQFLGTLKSGIFVTENGGEIWRQLKFPPQKVYGLAVDPVNSQIVYATGVYGSLAKIYKSVDGGEKWDEIYTEPTKGTVLTALAIDPKEPNVLYAGTSKGLILKTVDGGQTWSSVYEAPAAIIDIAFDAADNKTVYFAVFKRGLLKTRDAGKTVVDFTPNLRTGKPKPKVGTQAPVFGRQADLTAGRVTSLVADPRNSGTLYVGTDDGVYKSSDYANSWVSLGIIGSAKKLPVKALAVNPHDTSELIYSVARTLYRSGNNMTEWTPLQIAQTRTVSTIKFDPAAEGVVYLGMRKEK